MPPHTIIFEPVQTAAWKPRPVGAPEVAVPFQTSTLLGPSSVKPEPINVVSPGAPSTKLPDTAPTVIVEPTVPTLTKPLPEIVTESCTPFTSLTTWPEAIAPAVTALAAICVDVTELAASCVE